MFNSRCGDKEWQQNFSEINLLIVVHGSHISTRRSVTIEVEHMECLVEKRKYREETSHNYYSHNYVGGGGGYTDGKN